MVTSSHPLCLLRKLFARATKPRRDGALRDGEDIGDLDEARSALRTHMRRWPHSADAQYVRRHLSELNMRVIRGNVPAPGH